MSLLLSSPAYALEPAPIPPSLAGDSFGAGADNLHVGWLSFRFLLQTRYTRSFAARSSNPRGSYRMLEETLARDGDGFSLQRFFVRLSAEPSPYLELKTILDLAELVHDNVDSAVKQAYAALRPLPDRIEILLGLFKLPFSTLELDPIANYHFAELGAADDLVKALGFAGRDIGVELTVSPLPKPNLLRIALGVFRGEAHDEIAPALGTLGARVELRPLKGLRIGVDWVEHPWAIVQLRALETSNKDLLPHPADPQFPRAQSWSPGRAFSADARYQRHHLSLAVEGMIGDRVDVDTRYGARTFIAAWASAGYRFKVGPVVVLPAVRAAWSDADREHPSGARRELSVALNLGFSREVRLLLDVTRVDVESATPRVDQPKPLPDPPYYELSDTRVVAQVQVAL